MLLVRDAFGELARYYDPLMEHVDYDRWFVVAGLVAQLAPEPFVHADLGCGTAVFVKRLRKHGWKSFGFDLSPAMLRTARKGLKAPVLAAADLRALPLKADSIDYATCLFDSVNFLLEIEQVEEACRQVAGALRPGGVFYFDAITERMVLEHFADQSWAENNGEFSTSWRTDYNRKTALAETYIQVDHGPLCTIRERVYEQSAIENALVKAGFTVLGVMDAETWKGPRRKTVRLDFVAVKGPALDFPRRFKQVQEQVRLSLS
ncbi:MAG: class I SAM-dependent methyltransferase [FCB group bacterium]|nr:class I SAM-dependent methyltransferase [FCB group bacterium]